MENENNVPQTPDFSDIPALDDTQGLENFLNNEMLAAQGLQPQETPAAQQTAPAVQQPAATTTTTTTTPTSTTGVSGDTITLTREQLNAILASRGQAPAANTAQARPVTPTQPRGSGYSAQDQAFIAKALQQGYTLEQINNFFVQQRGQAGRIDPVLEQRLSQVEQKYLEWIIIHENI